jgi:putative transferase (TIGR04331 family)
MNEVGKKTNRYCFLVDGVAYTTDEKYGEIWIMKSYHTIGIIEKSFDLGNALNEIHQVNHTPRYWRTVIGLWLGYFCQVLFDRWEMIQRVAMSYRISGTILLKLPPYEVIPNDKSEFDKLMISDIWNHYIYGQILSRWTKIPCQWVFAEENQINLKPGGFNRNLQSLKNLLKQFVVHISRILSRPSDVFIFGSYLPRAYDLQLKLALGQAPSLWQSITVPQIQPIQKFRKELRLNAEQYTGFENCLRTLVSEQIPTIYLEGYHQLELLEDKLPYPKKPKVIFSSNKFHTDELFSHWAVTKKEQNGCKLVIGQHGGMYGCGKFSFAEKHELDICDRFCTWGWTDNNKKTYPSVAFPILKIKTRKWTPLGNLLLITIAHPRYSFRLASMILASQQLEYINDQFRFVDALPQTVRKKVLVRLYSHDYEWAQADRWKEHAPDIHIDLGTKPIQSLIKKSRLSVISYNSTSFLETLGYNTPTIIFLNPSYWELRESAQPYFKILENAGIFHETPESAAAKVTEVWEDVALWWNGPVVQEARREFVNIYARVSNKPIKTMKDMLTNFDNRSSH